MQTIEREIIDIWDNDDFWKKLEKIWCKNKDLVFYSIAALHNQKRKNVFDKLITLRVESKNKYFHKLAFEEIFPRLSNISIPDAFKCLIKYFEVWGNYPINEFEKYLTNHINQIDDAISYIDKNYESFSQLLAVSLRAMGTANIREAINKAIKYQEHPHLEIRRYGILALGLMNYSNHPKELERTIQFLETRLNISEPSIFFNTLSQAIRLLLPVTNDRRLQAYIRYLVRNKWNDVYTEIIYALWMNFENLDIDTVKLILLNCQNIQSSNGIIDSLDFAIEKLIVKDYELAVWFLENWSKAQEDTTDCISKFDSTLRKICESPQKLSNIITRWFASDESQFHQSAYEIISHAKDELCIEMDVKVLNELSQTQIHYTMRRIIGYCLVFPQKLYTMVTSFLKVKNNRQYVDELVYNYYCFLGKNFGGSAGDFIKSRLGSSLSEREKNVLNKIKSLMDSYYNALHSMPDIPELRPSIELRMLYQKAKHKQINEMQEKAKKESVFLGLVTETVLLHGHSWFFEQNIYEDFVDNSLEKLSEPSRLGHYENFWEESRLLGIDSIGLEYQLLAMRVCKSEDASQ